MPAVRPALGPSLPALLRERFGVAERTTRRAGVAVLLVLAALVALVATRDGGVTQLTQREGRVYTLLLPDGPLAVVDPRPGELTRVEGRRGDLRAAVTVRAITLPPYRGSAITGLAPVLLERRIAALRRRDPTFVLRADGRARVNSAPGYEIGFRTGPRGDRRNVREVVLTEDADASEGLLLTLSVSARGRRTARQRALADDAKSLFRSVRFGTDRP